MIVDDTEFNVYALKSLLEKIIIKADIQSAGNGIEALKKVKEKEYDLIFMDISMPVMDGISATKEIRKFE